MFKTLQEFQEHHKRMKEDPDYAANFTKKKEQDIKDYWNTLKPFQKAEDIPEIPVTNEEEYENFFKPKLIELGAIPKDQLKDGVWYYGDHRRCHFARWNADKNEFDYIRYKFGYRWDTCNHFEDDNGYALFVPIREANPKELEEIKNDELKTKSW